MTAKRNREAGQAGEHEVMSGSKTRSTNSSKPKAKASGSSSKNGSKRKKTPPSKAGSQDSSLNPNGTAAPSSSLRLVDDDDIERDRETTVVLHLNVYGKKKHVKGVAIRLKRELEAVGINPNRVVQDGEAVEDDYSDDRGETWHTLDWRNEDPEDEGLHAYDKT